MNKSSKSRHKALSGKKRGEAEECGGASVRGEEDTGSSGVSVRSLQYGSVGVGGVRWRWAQLGTSFGPKTTFFELVCE